MATAAEVAAFLQQASARSITSTMADADLTGLQQAGLLQRFTAADMAAAQQQVAQLEQLRLALAQEASQRSAQAAHVEGDTRKTHSILFHLSGVDHQQADLEHLQQEQSALKFLDEDLVKRQQLFSQLLVQRALVDTASPYAGGFVALTTAGRNALRDLNVRLYRVARQPFADYWTASKQIDDELARVAYAAGTVAAPLTNALPGVQRSYLWAVALGLAKLDGEPGVRLTSFLANYAAVAPLSDNLEDRLMAAEIVSALPATDPPPVSLLPALKTEVERRGVPAPVALGVAAIVLSGRRADGTFALDPLAQYLQKTRSFESAAMLAIVNRPIEELGAKFDYLRAQFAGWGYALSEDTELSSAYLACSELPANAISAKLSLLARGLAAYLEYPLVAAAILASIPVLEANETLNLVEKAYEILGQRTGPMSQAELITLAVRMVHGIQVASVDELDPTARAAPVRLSYAGMPPQFWMPVIITHHAYFATFSGLTGPHPGHVHAWGGGSWG